MAAVFALAGFVPNLAGASDFGAALREGRKSLDGYLERAMVQTERERFEKIAREGIAAAIFGIHASVCTKCVIGTAAKLDRCIGLPVGDRDLVAADVSQPAGATGPAERIRCVNTIFQSGAGIYRSRAAAGVILPFGLFIFFIIVFEFGLLAGSSTAFLLLG